MPQRFMVSVDTRRREATSETVKRSGRLVRSTFLVLLIGFVVWLSMSDIQVIRKKVDSQQKKCQKVREKTSIQRFGLIQ